MIHIKVVNPIIFCTLLVSIPSNTILIGMNKVELLEIHSPVNSTIQSKQKDKKCTLRNIIKVGGIVLIGSIGGLSGYAGYERGSSFFDCSSVAAPSPPYSPSFPTSGSPYPPLPFTPPPIEYENCTIDLSEKHNCSTQYQRDKIWQGARAALAYYVNKCVPYCFTSPDEENNFKNPKKFICNWNDAFNSTQEWLEERGSNYYLDDAPGYGPHIWYASDMNRWPVGIYSYDAENGTLPDPDFSLEAFAQDEAVMKHLNEWIRQWKDEKSCDPITLTKGQNKTEATVKPLQKQHSGTQRRGSRNKFKKGKR